METSESIKEIASALAKAQANLKSVAKTGRGNYGRYAELAPALEYVLPIISAQGLSVVQMPTHLEDGTTGITTMLMHLSGEWIRSTFPVRMQQQTPQGQGSAITYARRYALFAVLGIAGDDDDGQAGTDGNNPETRRQASPRRPAAPSTPPAERMANEAQIKLMLARSRDASGLTDRQEIYDFFLDTFGKMPNEVKASEVPAILSRLSPAPPTQKEGEQGDQ